MKLRTWLIPLILFLCLCVGVALVTRNSFTEITEDQLQNAKLYSLGELHFTDSGIEFSDFDDCLDLAEAVVVAHYTGKHSFTDDAIYSKIQVEQVLKGEQIPQELTLVQYINLYTESNMLYIAGSQLPLREGRSYLLLIQKVGYDPLRTLPPEKEDPYYAIGDSSAGIYEISDRVQTQLIEEGKVTLATLPEDMLILTGEQAELDLYTQLRRDALAWLQEVS